MRHLADDERRIDSIWFSKVRGGHAIKRPQHDADNQEQRKLKENCDPAGKQGKRRLLLPARRQQALDNELIGAVARSSEGSPAENARPERVRQPEVGTEIEHLQLARAGRGGMNRCPSTGNEVQDRDQSDEGGAHINRGLNYIGPDHCRQTAFECIDERQCSDDRNRRNLARTKSNRDHNRYGVDAHALGRSARQQEQSGGKRTQPAAEAVLDQFVSGVKIAAKIMRQQHKADHDAPCQVTHYYLQEGEVRVVGKAGNADNSERAGFGCDYGKRDGPPGNIAPSKKVIAQRALPLAEAQSKQRDARQIQRDNREIEFIQAHEFTGTCRYTTFRATISVG